jgi:hypothetical protein
MIRGAIEDKIHIATKMVKIRAYKTVYVMPLETIPQEGVF